MRAIDTCEGRLVVTVRGVGRKVVAWRGRWENVVGNNYLMCRAGIFNASVDRSNDIRRRADD